MSHPSIVFLCLGTLKQQNLGFKMNSVEDTGSQHCSRSSASSHRSGSRSRSVSRAKSRARSDEDGKEQTKRAVDGDSDEEARLATKAKKKKSAVLSYSEAEDDCPKDVRDAMCKRLTQIYEEVIECPVCFGSMDSTLKQCINGHGVCSSCASKINKCPLCQQSLVVGKNILLCRLLECFPKPCPNVARGCKTILSNKEHDRFCEFRISKCLKKSCEWEGSVKYLTGHVKTCTKVSDVLELSSANADTTRFYTINRHDSKFLEVIPIVFQNQLFWKYCYRDGLTKRFSYAFHHVATSKPTCSYVFIVSFKKGGVTYFTHCCKASTDFSGRMNKVTESGFIMPSCELERFRQPNSNKYSYCLKVIVED